MFISFSSHFSTYGVPSNHWMASLYGCRPEPGGWPDVQRNGCKGCSTSMLSIFISHISHLFWEFFFAFFEIWIFISRILGWESEMQRLLAFRCQLWPILCWQFRAEAVAAAPGQVQPLCQLWHFWMAMETLGHIQIQSSQSGSVGRISWADSFHTNWTFGTLGVWMVQLMVQWGPDLSLDENLLRLATRLLVASEIIVASNVLRQLNEQWIESERNVVLQAHFDSFCHLFSPRHPLFVNSTSAKALLARFNTIKVANYTAGRCSSMMCRPPRQINGSHVEIEVIGFGINMWLGFRAL